MKFAFIRDHLTAYPVDVSCRVLSVSRAGYYLWRDRPESPRQVRHQALSARIALVHQENRCFYGRRLTMPAAKRFMGHLPLSP